MSNSKIDKALKKALGNWESPVDNSHWHDISNAVNSTPRQPKKRPFMWIFFGCVAVGIVLYLNMMSNNTPGEGHLQSISNPGSTHNIGANVPNVPAHTKSSGETAINSKKEIITAPRYLYNVSQPEHFAIVAEPNFLPFPLENRLENNSIFLIPHHAIFANLFLQNQTAFFENNLLFENKQKAVRPQKKTHQLKSGPQLLISVGAGIDYENVKKTTTSDITHKDYQKAWTNTNNKGTMYNAKIEYYQPLIKGLGISGGLNYIQSLQHLSFNYIYGDIPVRDSASNQIMGYVHLPTSQQQIIPTTNITNTEVAILSRVYYSWQFSNLMDVKALFGASVDIYSQSKGTFYDIDKGDPVKNTRKHNGLLMPEWGLAFRYYLNEQCNINVGYNGRVSGWDLNQSHGSVYSRGVQQSIQIGVGIML